MDSTVDEERELAIANLKKRRDLASHVVAYVVVNAMLVGIWVLGGGGYFWPAWVLLGWGVGLAMNVWEVYFRRPITEADIERQIQRQHGR
ncbi:MAG TPA: 2TM domain-containing protein [Acidimicrobiia bacterium]|nr:2TM domain-containing protein [Acidimicrobiia bacterium]